jgi:sigma-E processing peptidase SpoIIGA
MDILLFLVQSFFYDALILSAVAWIIKKKVPAFQFITALFLSVVISFAAFISAPIFLFIVPVLTVKIAFAPQSLKGYAVSIIYFYTLSAFLSGILHILRYFINFDTMTIGGYLAIGVALALILTIAFMLKSYFLKRQHILGELEHKVEFYCGLTKATGIGFVDTGNELVDSKTAGPVMIVPRCKVPGINEAIENGIVKTWEIGYRAVDDEQHYLTAFRPTLLLIDDVIVKDVIVGLCETPFSKYDFLLQPEITVGL